MKPFQVHIIGSGSAVPSTHRAATSQVLHYNGHYSMIDCAEGTQMQLKKNKISLSRINRFLISHLHGDHYFGLIGLINTLHLYGKTQPITIYGPAALYDILQMQLKASDTTLKFPLIFKPLLPNEKHLIVEDDQMRCYSFPVRHRIAAWGFLFEEKPVAGSHARSYAFCTDTAFSPELAGYFKDVSVLYHEATFMDHLRSVAEATFHSTSVQAAQMAMLSGAGRLLIGHFSSRYSELDQMLDEAREVFPQTDLALDGMVVDIKP